MQIIKRNRRFNRSNVYNILLHLRNSYIQTSFSNFGLKVIHSLFTKFGKIVPEPALENLLKGLVIYDELEKNILFTPIALRLDNTKKILLLFISIKGWRFIGGIKGKIFEFLRPVEIEKKLNIPGGSLRPLLRKLKSDGLISKTKDGYFIPDVFVMEIGKIFQRGGENK